MATLSLRLSESLHRKLTELARAEGISLNQFVATAAAEKLAVLTTEEYLRERASRASRGAFEAALASVPDVPAINGDDLPAGYVGSAAKKPANKALQRKGRKASRR